jgi:hypothetical protein
VKVGAWGRYHRAQQGTLPYHVLHHSCVRVIGRQLWYGAVHSSGAAIVAKGTPRSLGGGVTREGWSDSICSSDGWSWAVTECWSHSFTL